MYSIILDLLKKKVIFLHIIRFIFVSSSILKINKKFKKIILFTLYYFFKFFILFYKLNYFKFNKIQLSTINSYKCYLVKFYNLVNNNLFLNAFNNHYLSLNNVYFFWYFFNKDLLVNLFLNLLMKKGQKYVSYKIFYNSLSYLKKLVGVQPLFLLKKTLYLNRFLFDIQFLKLRKKIITLPKLLSIKSQLCKSIKYLFNNFNFKLLKISKNKKLLSIDKKISYIILNSLFYNNRLNNIIKKENLIVKNNFYNLQKENYLSRYLTEMQSTKDLKKINYFKKKYKSLTKKDNILKYKLNQINTLKKELNYKKKFIFSKYQLNLQSKTKLKSKWF